MTSELDFQIPVSGIYVLDPSGIPLFARYYQGTMAQMDSTLLGGFFSAIEIFVKTSLDGLLSDIGMTASRFFFDRTDSGYIIVIIVATDSDNLVNLETLEIVRSLQKTLNNCFEFLSQKAKEHLMSVEVLIEDMGTSIDSFLLEASFEYLKPEGISHDYLQTMESQQLSDEKLDAIISAIKSNR